MLSQGFLPQRRPRTGRKPIYNDRLKQPGKILWSALHEGANVID